MGREGWLRSTILGIASLAYLILLICGCTRDLNPDESLEHICCDDCKDATVTIRFKSTNTATRAEEYTINDLSLIVFDELGYTERNIQVTDGEESIVLNLIEGRTYSFFACMNFGYHVFAEHISEMEELTYHTKSLDVNTLVIPACGHITGVQVYDNLEVPICMERLYAGISLTLDRSGLDDDVYIEVTGLRVKNCPKQTNVFRQNLGLTSSECFSNGWYWSKGQIESLNYIKADGSSDMVDIFLLENIENDTIDNNNMSLAHTYLEIEMDYLSYTHFNSEGPLIYRTYLGDGEVNNNILRNTHRTITILPEDDGLNEDTWRVDKTWIREFGPSKFASFPESFIIGEIGDTLHLWCEFYPPHAKFDVGLEELEHDKAEGIYDYIIDEDGHGVRLILKNPGVGIVYMQAGPPVNESAMWFVVVNQPINENINYGLKSDD